MRIIPRIGRGFSRTGASFAALAFSPFAVAAAIAIAPRLSDQQAPRSIDPAVRQATVERLMRKAKRTPRGSHTSGKVHFDLLAKLLADDRRGTPASCCLAQLDQASPSMRVPTQAHPLLEQPAPDFTLPDHEGRAWRLAERAAAGPVVLVFYLGYGCDVCVHHLFEINADLAKFRALGAEVVAISGDSADVTRERFDRYGAFDFPVLSDPDHRVADAYGVEADTSGGAAGDGAAADRITAARSHATFIVRSSLRDWGGIVAWANRDSTPFRGAMALLCELRRDGKQASSLELPTAALAEETNQQ